MSERTCSIDGCEKPTRSRSAEWCKMHYHRWYRHGSTDKVATRIRTRVNGSKYRIAEMPKHPLAGKSGKVYVHRAVLYDHIGAGVHDCHWCARSVCWEATQGSEDYLQVDHLNSVKDDNRLENLVPSCGNCNVGRAAQARHDALSNAGWWSNNDTVAHLAAGGRAPRIEDNRDRAISPAA